MRQVRLAKPTFDEADIKEINDDIASILRSGWLTTGKYAAKLEDEFRRVVGTKHAVAVNSGTAALHIMMASMRLRSRDEVVVPANTFASTANAVLYEGARPVVADCDALTFNVTAATVKKRIGAKTKAVLVTHIAGNPCEMDELAELCEKKGVELFEDAAHAIGSTYKGRACGSLSEGGAFSLYPTKVTTSAEGGVITTDSDALADFARLYRNVGRRELGAGPVEILGHNYRMSDVHAAIGVSQMKHLAQFVSTRNELAASYGEQLRVVSWVRPQAVSAYCRSSYYAYIVRVSDRGWVERDPLMDELKRRGVETTIMFKPLGSQPYFRGRAVSACPNADMVGRDSLVLPLHPEMTREDVKYVVSAMEAA